MKLHELVAADDPIYFTPIINEVLDSRFKDISWVTKGNRKIGAGIIDGEEFKIYLEPAIWTSPDGNAYKYINIAFAKIVDGRPTEKLQLNTINGSKIVGCITNALLDQVPLMDYDAITMLAMDNAEQRLHVYDLVARRRWADYKLHTILTDVKIGNGRGTIIMSRELARDDVDSFIDGLKKHGKILA